VEEEAVVIPTMAASNVAQVKLELIEGHRHIEQDAANLLALDELDGHLIINDPHVHLRVLALPLQP
ncbi:hypothetical protein Dimus_030199, partial [Dionaea muscipula]